MTDADVLIVGAGIAGLTLAHDLARGGRRVVALEAADEPGGLLRRGRLAGIDLDLGAESFATRTDAVASLIADAALDLDVVSPRAGGAHLALAAPSGEDGAVRAPLPRRTVLGIPADPLAPDVVALIGTDAAARAATEIDLPALTRAELDAEPSLFDLVAERCGPRVAERLVDTLCRSVYSRPAAELRLSALNPAMWRAVQAHGSLTAAASEVAQTARAGAAVGGISGGMWRLPAALASAARAHGADIRTGVVVDAVTGTGDRVVVHTSAGSFAAPDVVVATGPAVAARLLGADTGIGSAAHGDAARGDTPRPAPVRVVAAAVDHAGLDAFPVGSGVIVDPALASAAKALTHVNAKWDWADAATPSGRHLVRLSARDSAAAGLDTADDVARALSLLTGLDIRGGDVVDLVVQEWSDAVASGRTETLGRVAAERGLHLAGATAAGTGLASVIPHARALAAALLASSDAPEPTPSAAPTRSLA